MSTSTRRDKSLSPSASILTKGNACLNCRRRKIRCDGRRPRCGPCVSSDAFSDCEYADTGTTRTQALEAQIAVLQQRISQLEQGDRSSTPTALSQSTYGDPLILSSPPSFVGAVSTSSLLDSALARFLLHCADIGFFLNISRFQEAVSSTNDRPSSALLSVVYLWGIHLDPDAATVHESAFLTRAIESTAQGLTSNHPHAVLQCIQAAVLLANYFFRNKRILEGRYQASAAMSLVISSRLHMIRSSEAPTIDSILGMPGELPVPVDPIEEGERINAFWTVLALNNSWTAAEGTPSHLSYSAPGGRIDLPWPMDMWEYAQRPFAAGFRTSRTVQNFLDNQPDNSKSVLALHAKASILLEQASRVTYKFRPGMGQQEASQFFASFNALEQVITRFLTELPTVQAFATRTSPSNALLITSLAHASMIRLHAPFLSRNPSSRGKVVASTRAIVQVLQAVEVDRLPIVDSVMGIIWAMVCQVLIREISASGRNASSEPIQLLNTIMAAMGRVRSSFIEGQYDLIVKMHNDARTQS